MKLINRTFDPIKSCVRSCYAKSKTKINAKKTYFQKTMNMRKPLYLLCRTQIPEGYPIWKAIHRERTKTEKHVWNRAAVCNEK